jgi:hypothetical protein
MNSSLWTVFICDRSKTIEPGDEINPAIAGDCHSHLAFGRLMRLALAARQPRLRFGGSDHGAAAHALEFVEMHEVFLRLARLHGDAADRTVTHRGALARAHEKTSLICAARELI